MARYEADMLNAGYCEYLVSVKPSPAAKAAKTLIIVCAAALASVMLFLTLMTIPAVSFLLLAVIVFLSWYIWQFTKVEYEYIIASGELELSKIYGARVRKNVLTLKLSEVSEIFPETSASGASASDKSGSAVRACNKGDKSAYCLRFASSDGEKKILVISAPEKTLSCLKYYRRSAFVTQ